MHQKKFSYRFLDDSLILVILIFLLTSNLRIIWVGYIDKSLMHQFSHQLFISPHCTRVNIFRISSGVKIWASQKNSIHAPLWPTLEFKPLLLNTKDLSMYVVLGNLFEILHIWNTHHSVCSLVGSAFQKLRIKNQLPDATTSDRSLTKHGAL